MPPQTATPPGPAARVTQEIPESTEHPRHQAAGGGFRHLPDREPAGNGFQSAEHAATQEFPESAARRPVTESTETTEVYRGNDLAPKDSVHSVHSVHSVTKALADALPLTRPETITPEALADLAGLIERAAATRPWQRGLFALTRRLRSMADGRGEAVWTRTFRPLLDLYRAALAETGVPLTREAILSEFAGQFPKVRVAEGTDVLGTVRERMAAEPLPAAALDYGEPETRRLVHVCAILQDLAAPDRPFFLSCRTAADLMGTDAMTAARRLRLLVADNLLWLDEPGTATRAARYRCTPRM